MFSSLPLVRLWGDRSYWWGTSLLDAPILQGQDSASASARCHVHHGISGGAFHHNFQHNQIALLLRLCFVICRIDALVFRQLVLRSHLFVLIAELDLGMGPRSSFASQIFRDGCGPTQFQARIPLLPHRLALREETSAGARERPND